MRPAYPTMMFVLCLSKTKLIVLMEEIKAIMKTLEALPAAERGAMRVIPLHSQVPQELKVHTQMAKSRDKLFIEQGIGERDIESAIQRLDLEADRDFVAMMR